jgi:hypothetical protein
MIDAPPSSANSSAGDPTPASTIHASGTFDIIWVTDAVHARPGAAGGSGAIVTG